MRKEEIEQEIYNIAKSMIDESTNFVIGSRLINKLRFKIGEDENPIFETFNLVDSDTEKYPLGEIRKLYSADYLRKADTELTCYLDRMRKYILDACRDLVNYYSEN